MIIAAFISSFCIGLCFFIINIIFSNVNDFAFIIMIAGFFISFIIILFFGIPLVIILRKLKILNWLTILLGGFSIGFLISLNLTLAENIQGSAIQGLIGMVASAIFYKVLLLRTK